MRNLLELQALDEKISACKRREVEIPKQKNKFDIQRKRLQSELTEREDGIKRLILEQRESESAIEQRNAQIQKYNQQLNLVKRNEEYQALLHEIELEKKQISSLEERILQVEYEIEEGKEKLGEDRKRIKAETDEIDKECAKIDEELKEAEADRKVLEDERKPVLAEIEPDLLRRYDRLRKSIKTGPVVVAVSEEVCGGCHMHIRAQIAIEVMTGEKVHGCQHCGRLLYHVPNFETADAEQQAAEPQA